MEGAAGGKGRAAMSDTLPDNKAARARMLSSIRSGFAVTGNESDRRAAVAQRLAGTFPKPDPGAGPATQAGSDPHFPRLSRRAIGRRRCARQPRRHSHGDRRLSARQKSGAIPAPGQRPALGARALGQGAGAGARQGPRRRHRHRRFEPRHRRHRRDGHAGLHVRPRQSDDVELPARNALDRGARKPISPAPPRISGRLCGQPMATARCRAPSISFRVHRAPAISSNSSSWARTDRAACSS